MFGSNFTFTKTCIESKVIVCLLLLIHDISHLFHVKENKGIIRTGYVTIFTLIKD